MRGITGRFDGISKSSVHRFRQFYLSESEEVLAIETQESAKRALSDADMLMQAATKGAMAEGERSALGLMQTFAATCLSDRRADSPDICCRAFAHAENARACGVLFVASQGVSPDQTFILYKTGGYQAVFSPQPGSIIETRDKR